MFGGKKASECALKWSLNESARPSSCPAENVQEKIHLEEQNSFIYHREGNGDIDIDIYKYQYFRLLIITIVF